jgi:hypothetical protein
MTLFFEGKKPRTPSFWAFSFLVSAARISTFPRKALLSIAESVARNRVKVWQLHDGTIPASGNERRLPFN